MGYSWQARPTGQRHCPPLTTTIVRESADLRLERSGLAPSSFVVSITAADRRWLCERGRIRSVSAPRFRQENLAQELLQVVPEFEPQFVEHLDDMEGEILYHLLFEDLVRFVKAAGGRGDDEVVLRILTFVDQVFQDADAYVVNVVEVSFVESFEYWSPNVRAFIDTWPAALKTEFDRQQNERDQRASQGT